MSHVNVLKDSVTVRATAAVKPATSLVNAHKVAEAASLAAGSMVAILEAAAEEEVKNAIVVVK